MLRIEKNQIPCCTTTVLAMVCALLVGGCGGGSAHPKTTISRHYVDVTNGQMITAHTIGRDPVLLRDRSRIPDAPDPTKMPLRTTLAPERAPDALGQGVSEEPRNPVPPASAGTRPGRPVPTRGEFSDIERAPLPETDLADFQGFSSSNELHVVWAILLRSVSSRDEHHRQIAAAATSALQIRAPQLRGNLWSHTTDSGSVVLFGRFNSIDDPSAQRELKSIKQIEVQGKRPYSSVHLVRIELGGDGPQGYHEYDLRSLRKKHPKVDPLYTIDVAVWITPVDEPTHRAAYERSAEAYVAKLRGQGYEAYYYHDRSLKLSTVTIGKFDHTDITPESGLFSAAIRKVFAQFPKRLNNGEEMIDPNTRVTQIPQLVQVPKTLH